MRLLICSLILICCTSILTAQEKTGVWRGIVRFSSYGFDPNYNPTPRPIMPPNDPQSRMGRPGTSSFATSTVTNTETDTRAKLEWLQIDDRSVVQLTSYGVDNKLVTMYQFYARPTPKEFYKFHMQGKSVVVKETDRRADLFDMRGTFQETDSSFVFWGVWEDPFTGRRFGTFFFEKVKEVISINPELVYSFLKKNKLSDDIVSASIPAIVVHDTIQTDAIAVYGNLVDNGLKDQDTLSIWFNGKLLEDNIVPTDKRFFFRANLADQEWNYLTIRCKNEGKEKGAGVHLNLEFNDIQMKYNLGLFRYGQSDWVIHRKVSNKQAP
ncbi:hypothetical protein [Sediminibacterium sp. KACHI17]|uniref:hypothetical protein n=1 Tax=Sediminibacterium sp. KACHI17 TaxID=1751071 RepID=UPI0033659D6B